MNTVNKEKNKKKYIAAKSVSLGFGLCGLYCLFSDKVPLVFACAAMAIIISASADKAFKK